MGEPGPFGGGEGAAGLSWLLDTEPGGFRGGEQAGLDLVAGEDAAGDQAVEANPGLVQGMVAAASGSVGDGGQFLLERGAAVGMASKGRAERCRGNRLSGVGSGGVEEAAQRHRRWGELGGEWPQPPVAAAAGMSRRWGDHIAAAAPPVHLLQQAGPVAAAGWGHIEVPAASGPDQRSLQAQVVVGGEATYPGSAGGAVDVQDVGNLAGDQADIGRSRRAWSRKAQSCSGLQTRISGAMPLGRSAEAATLRATYPQRSASLSARLRAVQAAGCAAGKGAFRAALSWTGISAEPSSGHGGQPGPGAAGRDGRSRWTISRGSHGVTGVAA